MREYINHKFLSGEIKIGRFLGQESIECFYPKWVLEKFLESGYEETETIQYFLKNWDKVICQDYKKYGSDKLYQVFVNGFNISRISKIVSNWATEGQIIRIKRGDILINVATEHTIQYLKEAQNWRNVSLELGNYDPNEIVRESSANNIFGEEDLPF